MLVTRTETAMKYCPFKFASVSELSDVVTRQNRLVSLIKEIAWSFGFKISEDVIRHKLKERGRWIE